MELPSASAQLRLAVFHRDCPLLGRHVEVRPSKASRTASRPARRHPVHRPAAPAQTDRSGAAALRSVLRIRPFRRLWLVLGAASFGDWIGLLATSHLRVAAGQRQRRARARRSAASIAVRLLPALLLGPIAGVLADRFDRRYTMVICDLLRFVLFASIPLVALLGARRRRDRHLGRDRHLPHRGDHADLDPGQGSRGPQPDPASAGWRSPTSSPWSPRTASPRSLAALGLAALDRRRAGHHRRRRCRLGRAGQLALYFNAFSRLATALVVFFGIREIGGKARERRHARAGHAARSSSTAGSTSARPRWSAAWCSASSARSPAGGVVIGTAQFFATSLGAGDAAFYMLFGDDLHRPRRSASASAR